MLKAYRANIAALVFAFLIVALGAKVFHARDASGRDMAAIPVGVTPSPAKATLAPLPPPLSARKKSGLTICGLQPGDRIEEILGELPVGVTVQESADYVEDGEPCRRIRLADSHGRKLQLISEPNSDVVARVMSGREISRLLTIERSGKVVAHGGSWREAMQALNSERSHYLKEGSLYLEWENVSPDLWTGVSLSSERSFERMHRASDR